MKRLARKIFPIVFQRQCLIFWLVGILVMLEALRLAGCSALN